MKTHYISHGKLTRTIPAIALLGTCGLIAALSLKPAIAQAAPQETSSCAKIDVVKLQEYPGLISNLVPWVAEQQGIFKKYCLQAKMMPIPSAPAAYATSLQGGVDFVSTAPETAYIPVTQGMDIKLVASMNDTVYYALVVRKDLPLPHEKEGFPGVMKDLVGKKIGVNLLGSTTNALSRANFTAAGLSADDANWIAYGPSAAGIAALINGSVDAAQFFGDGMDIAAAATGGKVVGDLRDPATKADPLVTKMRGAGLIWAAQTAFIKKNPDVVRRFKQANDEAVAWIKDPAHFDQLVALVGKETPVPGGIDNPEALLKERVRRYVPQVSDKTSLRALQAWNDWALSTKRIPKEVDVKSLIWEGAQDMIVP